MHVIDSMSNKIKTGRKYIMSQFIPAPYDDEEDLPPIVLPIPYEEEDEEAILAEMRVRKAKEVRLPNP